MRGIRYVGLPTTLLAQVDSSLGGKTGVNLLAGKNLIGSFHHPLAVLADIDLLAPSPPPNSAPACRSPSKPASSTTRPLPLPRAKRRPPSSRRSEAPPPALCPRVIAASVRVKADVVSADEKESGLRMILNFGHTIGHAIEAATNYRKLLHGEAVAWGSIAALHVSLARAASPTKSSPAWPTSSSATAPSRPSKPPPPKLVALTASDKKTRSGRRAFVLATGIGSTEIVYDVTDAELLAATSAMLADMPSSAPAEKSQSSNATSPTA
jgi:3-dehydroquinate synthase